MIAEIPLIQITPGKIIANDRTYFEDAALIGLAKSISETGLIEPIVVRSGAADDYEIIAGERRFRAVSLYTEKVAAGEWEESQRCKPGFITAIIRSDSDDDLALEIMLVENLQREDLNPMEEAWAYQKRMEAGWSKARLVQVAQTSYSRVNSRLKLLALAPEIQVLVRQGHLNLGYAEEISQLSHDGQRQVIQWLNRQTYAPARKHVMEYVGKLKEAEDSRPLFDFSSLFSASAVEAAETEGKRVSDILPPLENLPNLPLRKGPIGQVIDAYIAELIAAEQYSEARVLMHLWRQLMKSNYAQVKPWDSKTLPLLTQLPSGD
ncbi:MAG: ParB/RepB/Spo0J family partition protein [Anaerolinea sp.]|nr:ParB/RepB/Spo0J family partition protein [Anaerolinea sp.]